MKVAAYSVVVLVSALVLAPVIYQAGKALEEVSRDRETNFFLQWFAMWAGRVDFHDVFVLTFLGLAVVLLWVLWDATGGRVFRGIGVGAVRRGGVFLGGTALVGLLVAGGLLVSESRSVVDDFGVVLFLRAIAVALLAAFAFEWFFRGVWYGVVAQAWGWVGAVGLSALVFVVFRLLLLPLFGGFDFVSRESWGLGWEMFGMVVGRCFDPVGFAVVVLPVFGWGVLLGWARMKMGGIGLPFCMHAGWLCVDRVFAMGAAFAGGDLAWICGCALGASVVMWVCMKPEPSYDD